MSVRRMSAAKNSTTTRMAMGCTEKPKGTGRRISRKSSRLTSLCSSMPTASPPPIPMTPIYRDSKTMIPAMFSLLIPSTL